MTGTGHPVESRMVRPQRRYASNYNISFMHEPPKPMARPEPEPAPAPESTFDRWRAIADAERERLGIDLDEPPDAAMPGSAPRRRLHDALLGTTAVVLLGVLGGAIYYAWVHDDAGAAAAGRPASKGSALSAFLQPFDASAGRTGPQETPDPVSAPVPREDLAAAVPSLGQAPQPTAPLPWLPVASAGSAPPTPWAAKPVLPIPAAPASGVLTMAAEAMLAIERATAAPVPLAAPSASGAAAPAPGAPAETRPVPEQAAMTPALPAKPSEPDAVPPVVATPLRPAPVAEPMAAQTGPSVPPREPEAAPAVPAIAAATVRLAPAPEWAVVSDVPLAPAPDAAALPTTPVVPPAVPPGSTPAAGPAVPVPAEMAKTTLPGVDAQQVVSTMQLVQQMSLLVHDMHGDSLRYRTEVTELTGAVQEKAANLEARLKRAEARAASGPGDLGDGGELRAAAGEASRALRRYHVQAGSSNAVVLSDGNAGPEQAARLLVIVGDQVPGAGRVRAIVPRGRSWLVQTDHGEIR